jgi:hypothetical protein
MVVASVGSIRVYDSGPRIPAEGGIGAVARILQLKFRRQLEWRVDFSPSTFKESP